ncbi:MAG: type 4a pilus biogenesis protein PilO [Sedimentisphaerales bacterium]|nr:type 4a pilus biogenesis protein PilO [Sedimentisphaerales bacterium]
MLICRQPKIFDVDAIGLAVLILTAACSWWLLLQPLQQKRQWQRRENEQIAQDNQRAQGRRADLQELVRRRQTLAAGLENAQSILRESTGLAQILRHVGRLCRDNGLRLDELDPQDIVACSRYQKRPLHLALHGGYPQVHRMLEQLAKELPFIRVSSLGFTKPSRTPGASGASGLSDMSGMSGVPDLASRPARPGAADAADDGCDIQMVLDVYGLEWQNL